MSGRCESQSERHPSTGLGVTPSEPHAIARGESRGQGLYDPRAEHDACGVGFVVHMKGQRSNAIVRKAMQVLINLEHRGACGCEANTGDGAGILIQMPDRFFRRESARLGFALPPERHYGAGFVFLPRDPVLRAQVEARFEAIVAEEGQVVLGWRDVPTDDSSVGASAVAVEPVFRQVFIGRGAAFAAAATDGDDMRFDLIGNEVNIAATLPARTIALSPEAFRLLTPDDRQAWKKHTPQVVYIPADDPRP